MLEKYIQMKDCKALNVVNLLLTVQQIYNKLIKFTLE